MAAKMPDTPVSFKTNPYNWKHWILDLDGDIATLKMNVQLHGGFRPGYELKLNSYDLGVDIELSDIIERLRFEQPQVRTVVVTSENDRVFCSGANIKMLASSSHPFKVNFCKFTNETRCGMEEASSNSNLHFMAAVNGPCAGGGYELAMACDSIYLIDDGTAAVSLPEVPLLAVLPGTGGLTRLTDKRKVRRDVADIFCTKAEGFKARDAVRGRLVDGSFPRSRWQESIAAKAAEAAAALTANNTAGIKLEDIEGEVTESGHAWKHITLDVNHDDRVAILTMKGPSTHAPSTHDELFAMGGDAWGLAAWRQFERALLLLRFNYPKIGLILLKTTGDADLIQEWDNAVSTIQDGGSWFAREITLFQSRALKKLDNMSRSMFAIMDENHNFNGSLFEMTLSADRSYMFLDEDEKNSVTVTDASAGRFPMSSGLTRLQVRFLGEPEMVEKVLANGDAYSAEDAEETGIVTASPDDIDWEDELRIAIEERVSLSPDALTGMEQNLRYGGQESHDTKIYGRLSAWQNWIFQRPNAVGDQGALTLYGHPERPAFDFRRT